MACLWFVGLSVGVVLLYRVVPPPITLTMILDRNGFHKDWAPLRASTGAWWMR
jgi:monofunctional biosynthetic peptidoglycan transglycosylase